MPRLPHVRFVYAFCWTVAGLGGLVIAYAVHKSGLGAYSNLGIICLAVGVIVGELVPLRLPLRGGHEEVNLSTTFSFAILLSAGLGPALIAQVVASVLQDLLARKPAWRSAFNIGQYCLSFAAAAAVLGLLGPGADAVTGISAWNLFGILLAGCAFFLVNFIIVGIAVSSYQRARLIPYLRHDLTVSMMMAAASITLAPLVLAAADASLPLLLLLVVPFIAMLWGGRAACESAHTAMHDGLTGLPNRTQYRLLLQEAIAGSDGSSRFGVMLVDLNRFKNINDTLGHHYGDLLLEQTGPRLRAALSEGDVIARLGGDEFGVLICDARGYESVSGAADRIESVLRTPFDLDGFSLEVDASIGIALCPDDGEDVDTLLRRADVAMYRAKKLHTPHVRYSSDIDEHSVAKLRLVSDLRRAIENDELLLNYQPIVDAEHGFVVGVESLVRWQHPELGLLGPGAFVEMAEQTGLIKPLTHWVLCEALRQCASWQDEGLDLEMSVNISPRTLLDAGLPEDVESLLERSHISPDRIKLEITENALMADPHAALSVLQRLRGMGLRLSIDDFGTGYSSLSYLKNLPVTEIKVDKSFVQGMASSESDLAIVRLTAELAATLGLSVVAEGVEDQESLDQVRAIKCDLIQGFYICHPLPAEKLEVWVRQHQPSAAARRNRLTAVK